MSSRTGAIRGDLVLLGRCVRIAALLLLCPVLLEVCIAGNNWNCPCGKSDILMRTKDGQANVKNPGMSAGYAMHEADSGFSVSKRNRERRGKTEGNRGDKAASLLSEIKSRGRKSRSPHCENGGSHIIYRTEHKNDHSLPG